MARPTQISEFPFVSGEHAEIDGKLLPDGYLTRAKNVRLRKDGRFGVRADFDALGNDTANSADIIPYDLHPFEDRLLAIVDGRGLASDTAPWDIAEYVGTAPIDWKLTASTGGLITIGLATLMKQLPALPSIDTTATVNVTRIDAAAAGGYVCAAIEVVDATLVVFHVLRAETGATVISHTVSGTRPRVVAVGTKFFLLYLNTARTTINQLSFDPAADTAPQTLSTLSSGTAVNCYDAVTDLAGTGYWVTFNLSTPTTSIVPVNSSGVAGTAITGPAVTYQHLAVRETSTRVHLVTIISAGALELRSYTTGGALSTGPTTIEATAQDRQPGIADATFSGTERVLISYHNTFGSPTVVRIENAMRNALTHANINQTILRGRTLGSKPAVGGAINFHYFVGGLAMDGDFLSHGLYTAQVDATQQLPYAFTDRFAAVAPATDTTPQIAKDASTGKWYWPRLVLGPDGVQYPRLNEFTFASNARRQSARLGGMLYLGGAMMQTFDGKHLAETGFFTKPVIVSATASNTAGGALPSNTTLLVAVVCEYVDRQGNLWSSDLSPVETVTMGASDDTITLQIVTPAGAKSVFDVPQVVAAYRSIDGINQLRRAETTTAVQPSVVSLVLEDADSVVREQGVIYTQAGRGILSGTLPHEAPLPADYVWKFGARLLCANANQAFVSKELFPGEPVNFSGDVGFTIPSIPERITGVAALDQRGFIFSAERVYWFAGDGPNDNGEGRYSEPLVVPGSTGLSDWRSLVETPLGLMFQGSNGQIWLLPRDGGAPAWIGEPVRDTLVSYPIVTSATLVTEEQLVSFTCNNAGETDCRVVHYDLRAKTWIVDEFGSSTPIRAACSYQGRLAFISAGVVYTEKTTLTPNTFIEHGLTTGTVNRFGSGWGKYCRVGLTGEYRGDCDLYLRVSYDDGQSYSTHGKIHQLRAAAYSVGETVDVEWTLSRWKAQSIRVDFSARTPGSASEGLVFNSWWLETMKERGGPRKASSERG